MNPRTDRAGYRSVSIRAFGWIVCDKRLDVVSSHRASVDKGSDDEAVILNALPGCQLRMFT